MMPRWTDPLRWTIRVPALHRVIHRLFPRPYMHEGERMVSCPWCAYVWKRLLADAGFREGLERGMADFAAGRTTRYEIVDGELVPCEPV